MIWATRDFFRQHDDAFELPVAPDICVEVLSPTNRGVEIDQKRPLYFESGAKEVWVCGLLGEVRFYTPAGQTERSVMCPEFPARVEL